MKKSIKIMSVLIAFIMIVTSLSSTAYASTSAKPKATSVSSVSANAGGFTVKWKKISNVTGYQVQYSTSSKFKNAKSVKVKKAKTVSKKITGLSSKKKYYVRVRTYKTKNSKTSYSAWSKSKSVTTKAKTTSTTTPSTSTGSTTTPSTSETTTTPTTSQYAGNPNQTRVDDLWFVTLNKTSICSADRHTWSIVVNGWEYSEVYHFLSSTAPCPVCGYDGMTDELYACTIRNSDEQTEASSTVWRNLCQHQSDTGHINACSCGQPYLRPTYIDYKRNGSCDYTPNGNKVFRYCTTCGIWETVSTGYTIDGNVLTLNADTSLIPINGGKDGYQLRNSALKITPGTVPISESHLDTANFTLTPERIEHLQKDYYGSQFASAKPHF